MHGKENGWSVSLFGTLHDNAHAAIHAPDARHAMSAAMPCKKQIGLWMAMRQHGPDFWQTWHKCGHWTVLMQDLACDAGRVDVQSACRPQRAPSYSLGSLV